MKILQMNPAFYPAMAYGGTVTISYQISKELVRRGHEVTVYTSDTLDKNRRQETKFSEIDGIKVYYFRNLSNTLAWHRFVVTPGLISQLSKEIKNFDIVHLHGTRNFQNIFVHHYAKKYGIPYVLQAHGSSPRIIEKKRLKKLYDWVWGYNILRDASKVVALTKIETEQYKKMGVDENKIEIVPNGIDLSEYENLPKRGGFRRKYKIKDDEKIILYLGRIHKIKGIDLLVKAFADLIKELDNIGLVIVGPDDGFLSTLKKQIKDLKISNRILFTGPLYERDKLRAYIDADVYVLPSVYETFGITVLEASACGTPIITTNNGDELDWIDDKVGYVVEYGKDQLQDAIVKMLSDKELRRRFGEEGKRLVREEFGWDKSVKRLEVLYETVIHSDKPEERV